jgi:hypothetical protein
VHSGGIRTQAVQKKSFIAVVVENKDIFRKAVNQEVIYRIALVFVVIQYESTSAYIKLSSDINNQTNILFIAL